MTTTERDARPRKDIRQDLAHALIGQIEAGTAPWQKPWNPADGDDAPINAVTGKRYRGINHLWLAVNQPDSDPRWCTFKQAQEKNWHIRKGSHGTLVEKWMVLESKDPELAGDVTTPQEERLVVRYYTVFHASQIEGMPELVRPELPETSLEPDPRVAAIVSGMGATLSIGGTQAYYRPSADVIRIPALTSFATAADYDTVLLHEIGHATGHKNRLNRYRDLFGRIAAAAIAFITLYEPGTGLLVGWVWREPHRPYRRARAWFIEHHDPMGGSVSACRFDTPLVGENWQLAMLYDSNIFVPHWNRHSLGSGFMPGGWKPKRGGGKSSAKDAVATWFN